MAKQADLLHRETLFKVIFFFLLLCGLAVGLVLVRRSQDLRQKASTGQGTAQLSLVGETQLPPNTSQSLAVKASNLGINLLDGFQVMMTVKGTIPTDLEFQPANIPGLTMVGKSITDENGDKKITFALITSNPEQPFQANNADVVLGVISFTTPASGQMDIDFDPALSKILRHGITDGSNPDILITPTDTSTPTYYFQAVSSPPTSTPETTTTPTPSPTVKPTLPPQASPLPYRSFHFRVQVVGVNEDRGPIRASVRIGNSFESAASITKAITMHYAGNGVYEGQVDLTSSDADLASGFWVTVKAEKHIQRLFTNLTLSQSDEVLDFTQKPLQPGDLATQDGTVDFHDINKVLGIMAKPVQTADDLRVADVNYDGIVNAADMGLIFTTLSTKTDEGM